MRSTVSVSNLADSVFTASRARGVRQSANHGGKPKTKPR